MNKITIAKEIEEIIMKHDFSAFTLSGGYGVLYPNNGRVLFPPGRAVCVRKNDEGRTTFAEFEYEDGSRLMFKYSLTSGVTLKVGKEKR